MSWVDSLVKLIVHCFLHCFVLSSIFLHLIGLLDNIGNDFLNYWRNNIVFLNDLILWNYFLNYRSNLIFLNELMLFDFSTVLLRFLILLIIFVLASLLLYARFIYLLFEL